MKRLLKKAAVDLEEMADFAIHSMNIVGESEFMLDDNEYENAPWMSSVKLQGYLDVASLEARFPEAHDFEVLAAYMTENWSEDIIYEVLDDNFNQFKDPHVKNKHIPPLTSNSVKFEWKPQGLALRAVFDEGLDT